MRAWGWMMVAAIGCGSGSAEVTLDGGAYWLSVPPGADGPMPAVVHLHAHDGNPASYANNDDLLARFADEGLVAAFPAGEGGNWAVGHHVDEIERDDREFLADVARDLLARDDVDAVWLSGHSEGAAMVYDMACLGDGVFAGYLPIAGAFWKPVPQECTTPAAPIRHAQGTTDGKWPLDTADDLESSHEGIRDSLRLLQSGASCGVDVDDADGCEVFAGCDADVRLCLYDGGHAMPADWVASEGQYIQSQR